MTLRLGAWTSQYQMNLGVHLVLASWIPGFILFLRIWNAWIEVLAVLA